MPKTEKRYKPFTVMLEPAYKKQLDKLAKKLGKRTGVMLREFIEIGYQNNFEKKP